jgi:hypothetical protein
MAALTRAQKELTDPQCVKFLQQILAWARNKGIGNVMNLTVDSLSMALFLAVRTTQFGSKSHPEMANNPSIRAAVEGSNLYLGDAFFAVGSSVIENMQTLIHEAFHLAISPDRPRPSSSPDPAYLLYGAALSDEELAHAAGVYQNHWDTFGPRERRSRASAAFSEELARHCR